MLKKIVSPGYKTILTIASLASQCVVYLNVSRPGSSDEPSPRAIQSHGSDLVFVVGVGEAEDLSTAVDVPHVHLPSLTPTHNLPIINA